MSSDRGHRWALLRTERIGSERDPLLLRVHLVRTPWFGIYLHRHLRPDADRELHDHPWSFVSLVLRGGYTEDFASSRDGLHYRRRWRRLSIHRMRRGEFHRVRRLHGTTWTLLLVGKRRGSWGFAAAEGWVYWEDFVAQRAAREAVS